MRDSTKTFVTTLLIVLAPVLIAQEEVEESKEMQSEARLMDRFDVWLKGQGLLFNNFFQASEGRQGVDVEAIYAEAGAYFRMDTRYPLRAYLSGNTVQYQEDGLDSSEGLRVGVRGDGRPHSFDAYFDYQMDRPTFDVGDVFDRADVSTLSAQYGYRVDRDWEVKIRGQFQDQSFDLTPSRDNEFSELGGAVRFRGFSRIFSPEIGFVMGERDVDDPASSYDQDETYLQVRSAISPRLYASARLRFRDRTYVTANPGSSNFGRSDDRWQLSGYADYELLEALTLNFYFAYEDVDSSIVGRDFDTSMLMAGVTYHF